MINTIEVAPAILAASLADALSETFYIFRTQRDVVWEEPLSRHDLREFIKDFLEDKQ